MSLLLVLFLIMIAFLAIVGIDDSRSLPLSIAITVFLLTTGSVILFGKPLQLAQAFREHRIISLAAMVLLLLLLASAATYGYVHQYNVNVRYSMRGCGQPENDRQCHHAILRGQQWKIPRNR